MVYLKFIKLKLFIIIIIYFIFIYEYFIVLYVVNFSVIHLIFIPSLPK